MPFSKKGQLLHIDQEHIHKADIWVHIFGQKVVFFEYLIGANLVRINIWGVRVLNWFFERVFHFSAQLKLFKKTQRVKRFKMCLLEAFVFAGYSIAESKHNLYSYKLLCNSYYQLTLKYYILKKVVEIEKRSRNCLLWIPQVKNFPRENMDVGLIKIKC